jgi:hypothetical protein
MSTLLLIDGENPECVIPAAARARTRLWTRLHRSRLDHALAAGASPDSSAPLSLRASELIGTHARTELARRLRRLVDDARSPLGPLSPGVPMCRRKVFASRAFLYALADRLESSEPVAARGVAQLRLLVTGAVGPIHDRPIADDLEPALQQAQHSLELAI